MLLLKAPKNKPLTITLPPNSKRLATEYANYALVDAELSAFTTGEINDYSITAVPSNLTIALGFLDYSIFPDGTVKKWGTGPVPTTEPLAGQDLQNFITGAKFISKLNISDDYNKKYEALVNTESDLEQSSWAEQLAEAQAYLANNSAPTPLLSVLAPLRNNTVQEYAQKVVTASENYKTARNNLLAELKTKYQELDYAQTAIQVKELGWL